MSFGKFTRQEIIDLISGSWSPYWGGTGGGGTPGGTGNSIQFNSASVFSGSSTFTYDPNTNGLYYTGSFFVSGAISASYVTNTVGFYGTSSWAVSASWAPPSQISFYSGSTLLTSALLSLMITGSGVSASVNANNGVTMSFLRSAENTSSVNGVDEYIARFSGSSAVITSSFINRAGYNSFHTIDLDSTAYPFGYTNNPYSGSFIMGQQNMHYSSYRATSIADATMHGNVTSSLTTNYGTSVSNDYDVAMNYINSTSPRIQFTGYSTRNVAGYPAALISQFNGANSDEIVSLLVLVSGAVNLIIYDHVANKLIKSANYTYSLITADTDGAYGGTLTGRAIGFTEGLVYYDGTAVQDIDNGLFSVFLVGSTNSYTDYKANLTTGIANAAYGIANQANGYNNLVAGFANQSNGIGSVVAGSGSVSYGIKNGVWSQAGTALGAYNISGKHYWSNEITHVSITGTGYDGLYSTFPTASLENIDLFNFLTSYAYTDPVLKTSFPAIVIIPTQSYCGLVELFAYNNAIYCTSLLPTGSSADEKSTPHYAQIILSDSEYWYISPEYDTRNPLGNNKPYATTAIGYNSAADGTASLAGGVRSVARGEASLAYGTDVYSINNRSITFGQSISNNSTSSFMVGWGSSDLFVQQNFVGVNSITVPSIGFTGLRVSDDLYVDRDTKIVRNLYVTGSTYLGTTGYETTYITGSLIVTGLEQITGSLIITGSQTNIGIFTNTGSVNITGSLTVIGPLTANNVYLTGSLSGSFIGTGSGDFNGRFIGVFTGSNNPGISFIGTSSYALTASFITSSNVYGPHGSNSILSSSYAVIASTVEGGAQNYVALWNTSTSLTSSAATDNGNIFSVNRNTAVTGTFAVNVPSAVNQNQPAEQINTEGVLIIGSFNVIPTAVAGGMYFDGTDYYLGFA